MIHNNDSWRNSAMGDIVTALGAHKSGSEYIANCPVHGGESFSITEKNGRVLMHCFAGCDQLAVLAAIRKLGVQPGVIREQANREVIEPDQAKARTILRIWNEGRAVQAGDAVDLYLRNRGIVLRVFPDALRLHPALGYWLEKELIGTFPAMLARVTSIAGELVSVHRTYLTESGNKADVPQQRKLMSPALPGGSRGGAIRLFSESKVLAVGEGIETCLAVHSVRHCSIWSTISATGMASLVVPDSVEAVIIYADKDINGAGERAAQRLAERLYRDGKKVSIALPPGPIVGKSVDWADVVRSQTNHGQ